MTVGSWWSSHLSICQQKVSEKGASLNSEISLLPQGCTLAEPGDLWCLTFALGLIENLTIFVQIKCWVPWISQVQSTGLPSIFLRTQPCVIILREKGAFRLTPWIFPNVYPFPNMSGVGGCSLICSINAEELHFANSTEVVVLTADI